MRTSLSRRERENEEEQGEDLQKFYLETLSDRELLLKMYSQQQQILVGQRETKGGHAQTNLLLAGLSNRVKALEDNRRVVPSSAGSNKYTLSIRFLHFLTRPHVHLLFRSSRQQLDSLTNWKKAMREIVYRLNKFYDIADLKVDDCVR
jgi:hypothetical protein